MQKVVGKKAWLLGMKKLQAGFEYELSLWKRRGFVAVAGCDEVGRGSLAGPVVAATVAFPPMKEKEVLSLEKDLKRKMIIVNDSKVLTEKQRLTAELWIRKNALFFGIGKASVAQINKYGIVKATQIAVRRSIIDCRQSINHLLVDAFYIPYIKGLGKFRQTPIVRGDKKSFSVAAASILAKTYRDRLMCSLGKISEFERYRWTANKGYGTKEHILAIKQFGITKHHRSKFVSAFFDTKDRPL
jgi:ribonuclease HII